MPRRPVRWLVSVLLVSAALRLAIIVLTNPVITFDSPSYTQLASAIRHLDLSGDKGERVPIYPLFLILFGDRLFYAGLGQALVGLLSTAGLCLLAWKLTQNEKWAALGAAFYGLNLAQIWYERTIESETLCTFFVVVSALLLVHADGVIRESKPVGSLLLGLGLCSSLAALTRPLFLFLPLLAAGFCGAWLWRVASPARALRGAALVLIAAVLLVGGWSTVNYARLGHFGPTTLAGYNMTNQSGAFFESLPDKDAGLRDVYLRHRAVRIAATGRQSMTIWRAYPEMMTATGLSYPELSRRLTGIAVKLFLRRPVAYSRSIVKSWIQFWNAPGFWRWEGAKDPRVGRILGGAWRVEKLVLVGVNGVFLIVSLGIVAAFDGRVRRRWPLLWSAPIWVLAAIVVIASVVQAIMETGNSRYALPTQPLVACVICALGYAVWTLRGGSPQNHGFGR